jgi:hypothetical protein
MRWILYALGALVGLAVLKSVGEEGCMDKSKHAYFCNEGCTICRSPDYKQLYYVNCSCPCSRFPQLQRFGQCLRCKHYRVPRDILAGRGGRVEFYE